MIGLKLKVYLVLFDFEPEFENELKLRKGEKIEVIRTDLKSSKDGWWFGMNGLKKKGYFPASYVELIVK